MNPTTTTFYMPIRLSRESAAALQQEAEKFGLSREELASTILNSACPFDIMTDDESGHSYLTQMRELYPHRWPQLKDAYLAHDKALARTRDRDQAEVNSLLDETITLTLPPAMIAFMRETGKLFPELWDIFVGECLEAILDGLPHYLDNAFSFESTQDRRNAFARVKQATDKYLQSDSVHRRMYQSFKRTPWRGVWTGEESAG